MIEFPSLKREETLYECDFRHLEFRWNGRAYKMSRVPLLLLECLLECEPGPVTIDYLKKTAWRYREAPADNTISVYFCKLRGELAETGLRIVASRGLGRRAWRIIFPKKTVEC